MPRYIAFLRGMNLGKRRLPMSRLKELFEEIGFREVTTFIASGNVLFSSKVKATQSLESQIAGHLENALGYRVDTFVRTDKEVAAVGSAEIFPEAGREGITIHVAFLQQKLSENLARRLAAIRTAHDEFQGDGREYYWLCRIRTSDSKVWTLPELRALKLPTATMRNLTSIQKLVAKHLAGER